MAERCDLMLTPTLPVTAFAAGLDQPGSVAGRTTEYLSWTAFTYPFNVTGQPAATVPCGSVDGLPVGLQIVGRRGADALVLRAAAAFEQAHPWRFPDCDPQVTTGHDPAPNRRRGTSRTLRPNPGVWLSHAIQLSRGAHAHVPSWLRGAAGAGAVFDTPAAVDWAWTGLGIWLVQAVASWRQRVGLGPGSGGREKCGGGVTDARAGVAAPAGGTA